MCIGDAVAGETHGCVDACPACYIFTPDSLLKIVQGDTVELGPVDLFLEIAQVGCRFCLRLCELWSLNEEMFQTGYTVSVKRHDGAPPGLLIGLFFDIKEPLSMDWMSREGGGSYRDRKFITWSLPFGIFTMGTSELLDHFIVMRPPSPVVNRQEVFTAFKAYLGTCVSSHEECKKPDPSKPPTRVLRLDHNNPDRVFVHASTPGEQVEYIALSYCWGKTEQVMLRQANVNEFSRGGIEVSKLPRTIRDAIESTRKLGMTYIWIDVLCIIQDSDDDKAKELANMANIYKNASLTISAAAATDCGQGFLEDRPEVQRRLDYSVCIPVYSEEDSETRVVIDWIYLCSDPYIGHKPKLFADEPINTRAWTYQESTLAPRLLIFGTGPPQWNCEKVWRIPGLELGPNFLPNPEPITETMKITIQDGSIVPEETLRYKERLPAPSDDISQHLSWLPILENYSKRSLSYQTDKLAAVSALAAEHQSREQGTYAAGLWTASLPRSLLWRRHSPGQDTVVVTEHPDPPTSSNPLANLRARLARAPPPSTTEHPLTWLRSRIFDTSSTTNNNWPTKYIAPTWSPMSSPHPITYSSLSTRPSSLSFPSTPPQHITTTSLVTIHTTSTAPSSALNPHGPLHFAHLDLTAPLRPMTWSALTAHFVIAVEGTPFEYWDVVVPDDAALFADLAKRWPAAFNPQVLADRQVQHAVDEGDASIFIGDNGVSRIRMPVKIEDAVLECEDSPERFQVVRDVRGVVIDAVRPGNGSSAAGSSSTTSGLRGFFKRHSKTPSTSSATAAAAAANSEEKEPEFWLLEIERSMVPAGLVLRRVEGDIFARVGYYCMNRALDPEVVVLPGRVQVRGRRNFNFGGAELPDTWFEGFKRKRIYLV